MKRLFIVFAFLNCCICYAQNIIGMKIYIANPYVERSEVIKCQAYNMDYVRAHHASYIFSMEENYINALYDSLASLPLTRLNRDSISTILPYGSNGNTDMYFEPCVVIDFILANRFNTDEEVWTFSIDRQGYVCRTFWAEGNVLCYPNIQCIAFLKRRLPGLFIFRE